MKMGRAMVVAVWTIAAVVAGFAGASSAPASADEALNGMYMATSDGDQGTRNDVPYGWLYPYPTVTQTWTFTSTCHLDECFGRVTSDQGWSADARWVQARWFISYDRPDGVVCADGTEVPSRQTYGFSSVTFMGMDTVTSASGACNRNLPTVIERPLTLTKAA
ncbi:MAG: hypothetical protein JWR37_3256 [Mycobacterium sp.]|nr:hypothetical protein [Mycobacterium sp.]